MKAGLASLLHGIEKNDHGELPFPGAWPQRIEMPFEMPLVLPVVLDLLAGAAQRPNLQ
jgi:hypothetical protein